MKIAILSGKGGAGKTLLSVNLASLHPQSTYIDCDVEEPNGHLFLKPEITKKEIVYKRIPVINHDLCDGCRKCVDFCAFNALAFISGRVKVFEKICHSCGGCSLVCPQDAINEKEVRIGDIRFGKSANGVNVLTGTMDVGEQSGVAIINQMLDGFRDVENPENAANAENSVNVEKSVNAVNAVNILNSMNQNELDNLEKLEDPENVEEQLIFIDSPPGASCLVIESIDDADYCVLVTEPGIFGSHDLEIVYDLVTLLGKKCGLVINKDNMEPLSNIQDNDREQGNAPNHKEIEVPAQNQTDGPTQNQTIDQTYKFAMEKGIKILGRIPFDKDLAALAARAGLAVEEDADKYRGLFEKIYKNILEDMTSNSTDEID